MRQRYDICLYHLRFVCALSLFLSSRVTCSVTADMILRVKTTATTLNKRLLANQAYVTIMNCVKKSYARMKSEDGGVSAPVLFPLLLTEISTGTSHGKHSHRTVTSRT